MATVLGGGLVGADAGSPTTLTAAEQAIAEIDGRLAVFTPQYNGLKDYMRLELHGDTTIEVNAEIVLYRKRLDLLTAAREALQALLDDGHPDLPVRDVSLSVLADLQSNAAMIEAALSRFAADAATTMAFAAGAVEPK